MAGNSTRARVTVPTVSELLESPSVQALADRWKTSAVAAGFRTFVEELRGDLLRRVDSGAWPTSRELAEQAAGWLLSNLPGSERPAINATGQLWGGPWVGLPQCDAALEQAFTVGREFVMDSRGGARNLPLDGEVETRICQCTGAEAAVVVHSYASAVWLALASLGKGREVLVARGEVAEIERGCAIDAVTASAGVILREIGAVNRVAIGDFEAALTDASVAMLGVAQDEYQIIGATSITTREERVALARDRELITIEAVGFAPLVESEPPTSGEGDHTPCSIRQCLHDGVSLVVARGDGFTGGPPCGIIAGEARRIEQIMSHPMFAALQLEPTRRAGLAAALKQAVNAARGQVGSPIVELIRTPLENLKHRAERLAAQLSQTSGIASADPISIGGRDAEEAGGRGSKPSHGVALLPVDGQAARLVQRLANAWPPILVNLEDGRVVLDLRCVFPRHDAAIAAALAASRETSTQQRTETVGQ